MDHPSKIRTTSWQHRREKQRLRKPIKTSHKCWYDVLKGAKLLSITAHDNFEKHTRNPRPLRGRTDVRAVKSQSATL